MRRCLLVTLALALAAHRAAAQRSPPDRPALTGRTDRAAPVRRTPTAWVRVPAGEFVMGVDTTGAHRAMSLCRRERSALAEALHEPVDSPLFDLRARALLLVCGPLELDLRACDLRDLVLEMPSHAVWLGAYRIGRTEVTRGEYARCVAGGGCREAGVVRGARSVGAAHPVVGVSWDDARDYCAWAGGRLPTEAEWERAARGTDERTFPWGWQWDGARANHGAVQPECADARDGWAFTAPVGSYPEGASPVGALDMAGNVMEWVADSATSSPYAPGRAVAPRAEAVTGARVARGGAWNHPSFALRTTWRARVPASARDRNNLGFRCAWDAW